MEFIREIINKRATPGVLIIDSKNQVLHSNQEALAIIPKIQRFASKEAGCGMRIPEEIASLCDRLKLSDPPVASVHGKAAAHAAGCDAGNAGPYALRAFYIYNPAGGSEEQSIMVLMERVAEKHEVDVEKARRDYGLSKREGEVLSCICRGMSNREISAAMFICEYTVKDHIKKIMKRMNLKSRTEIAAALR